MVSLVILSCFAEGLRVLVIVQCVAVHCLHAVHNSAMLYIPKQQEAVKVGTSRKSFVIVG